MYLKYTLEIMDVWVVFDTHLIIIVAGLPSKIEIWILSCGQIKLGYSTNFEFYVWCQPLQVNVGLRLVPVKGCQIILLFFKYFTFQTLIWHMGQVS